MQAVILAAGKSSRFYPFGELAHKSLVSVMGKPLIVHTLENLSRNKVDNVVIVVDATRKVEKIVNEYNLPKNLKIQFVVQKKALGMGNALLAAEKYLEDQFFLLNAYHVDLGTFTEKLLKKKDWGMVLVVREVDQAKGFGFIRSDKDRVYEVVEKPEDGQSPSRLKVVGIYLLQKKICNWIKKEKEHDYQFENALTSFAKNNVLRFIKTKEVSLSLKYPWDLLAIKDYLLKKMETNISSNAKISQTAVIKGNVTILDNAEVMDGAVITGPCFIGKGSYVGTNSILRNSTSVENNVVVGAHMEVKNAIIMEGTTLHGGYIGDSIIGSNNKIAAYFCTANVRLDRENVHVVVDERKIDTGAKSLGVIIGHNSNIGVHVATMPGVIIGNNCVIGPNTNVAQNVQSDMYYYSKLEGIIEKKKNPKLQKS